MFQKLTYVAMLLLSASAQAGTKTAVSAAGDLAHQMIDTLDYAQVEPLVGDEVVTYTLKNLECATTKPYLDSVCQGLPPGNTIFSNLIMELLLKMGVNPAATDGLTVFPKIELTCEIHPYVSSLTAEHYTCRAKFEKVSE